MARTEIILSKDEVIRLELWKMSMFVLHETFGLMTVYSFKDEKDSYQNRWRYQITNKQKFMLAIVKHGLNYTQPSDTQCEQQIYLK
jgi:hypothetical protein